MKNTKNNNIDTLTKVATGAAIGAGAAMVASNIMKDEKNAKNIKKVVNKVKKETIKRVTPLQKEAIDILKPKTKNIKQQAKKLEKKINSNNARIHNKINTKLHKST